MSVSPLGFIELFVTLLFGLGWALLELVGLRLDKRKREAAERSKDKDTDT